MLMPRWSSKLVAIVATFILVSPAAHAALQPNPAEQPAVAAAPTVRTDSELVDIREQLLSLLRMSPTLTQVLETDPTLLADQEYINRSNPQSAQYLTQHPEVTRNPDFYLFANFPTQRGRYVSSLHRRVGGGRNRYTQ